MINGYPLNTAAINSARGSTDIDPVDPAPIDPPPPLPGPTPPDTAHPQYPGFPPIVPPAGYSLPWTVLVLAGGLDVTDRLTGAITVDREESASGVASFELFYPPGNPVPVELHDSAVQIIFTAVIGDIQIQTVLFTGWVTEPVWQASDRIMRVTATDMLQTRVEAMSTGEIDMLTGGRYSEDVFGEIDSHWQYAQDRMSTRTAALDCDTLGQMRTTSWYASRHPHFLFSPGSVVYQSVDVRLAQPDTVIGTYELSLQYRYQRLHRSTEQFGWTHPGTGGSSGVPGFCNWRQDSSQMPTQEMAVSAVTSAGLVPIRATFSPLPPTMGDPCGTGSPWINSAYPSLLQGFNITGAKQWTQSITESYEFVLTANGKRTERSRQSAAIDSSASEIWGDLKSDGGFGSLPGISPGDTNDEDRRQAFISTGLRVAEAQIVSSHRQNRASWQCPTALVTGIDLVHTLELDDHYVRARGKCVRRLDELNIESGSALTTLTIALMRGGGESSALTVPPRPGAGGNASHSRSNQYLPTQLGGKLGQPDYDENLDGFSGQYSVVQSQSLEQFPYRLAVTAAEYGEADTAELTPEAHATYSVGVPNDLLEL